jgi:hypothetical protein
LTLWIGGIKAELLVFSCYFRVLSDNWCKATRAMDGNGRERLLALVQLVNHAQHDRDNFGGCVALGVGRR